MPIELPQDEIVTIPPTPEVVADKLWMTQLIIRTPGPTDPNSLVLEYQPWTGGAGAPIRRTSDGSDTTKIINVTDVFSVATEVPEMAQAMGAILVAIPALIAYMKKKEQEAAAEGNISPE